MLNVGDKVELWDNGMSVQGFVAEVVGEDYQEQYAEVYEKQNGSGEYYGSFWESELKKV